MKQNSEMTQKLIKPLCVRLEKTIFSYKYSSYESQKLLCNFFTLFKLFFSTQFKQEQNHSEIFKIYIRKLIFKNIHCMCFSILFFSIFFQFPLMHDRCQKSVCINILKYLNVHISKAKEKK